MVVIRDPVLALDFDLAATVRLLEAERKAVAAVGMGGEESPLVSPRARVIDW